MMETDIYSIIREYRGLKGSSYYPFKEGQMDSDYVKEEKRKNRKRISETKDFIASASDANSVRKQKENVINALNILLRFVKNSNAGYHLDRNQGLGIENYVFGKVIGVISSSLTMIGVSYPDFYYTDNGDFEEGELRELLESFRSDLQMQEFSDFFELEEIVDEYLNKLRIMWVAENQKKLEQAKV